MRKRKTNRGGETNVVLASIGIWLVAFLLAIIFLSYEGYCQNIPGLGFLH